MKIFLALAFCFAAFNSNAGDLVLRLGTTGQYRYSRIPIVGVANVAPASGDIFVDPIAESGIANDGWCPPTGTGGTSAPYGPSAVLQLSGGVMYRIPIAPRAIVSPSNGDYTVTPIATSGIAGDAWCPPTGATSGDPPVLFSTPFTVNPTTLPEGGGTVSLIWGASGATSCSGSSFPQFPSWNGPVALSGSASVELPASGFYAFNLTCTNASRVASATKTVSSPECFGRDPPVGLTRQNSMFNSPRHPNNSEFPVGATLDVTSYSPIFGPTFASSNQSAFVRIDTQKYVALAFNSGTTGSVGHISWSEAQAPLQVMISPCQGDFESMTDAKCKFNAFDGSIYWTVGPLGSPPTGACRLDPTKAYFLNAIVAAGPDYSISSCPYSICDWIVDFVGAN